MFFQTTPLSPLPTSTSHTLILAKASLLQVYSNIGSTASTYTTTFTSQYPANTTIVEVLSCQKVVVGTGGSMSVTVSGKQPLVSDQSCLLLSIFILL